MPATEYEFQTLEIITFDTENSPPRGGNKRRYPAVPTPYRKTNNDMTREITFDDEEPGPSTAAFEVEVSQNDSGLQQ